MIGVEPWGFTLRELDRMLTARSKEQWKHTTYIVCAVKNVLVTDADDACSFDDVYPFAEETATDMTALSSLWLTHTDGKAGAKAKDG